MGLIALLCSVKSLNALLLGDAYARLNAQEAALQAFDRAIGHTGQSINLTVHLAALGSKGNLYEKQGHLPQAAQLYRRVEPAVATFDRTI